MVNVTGMSVPTILPKMLNPRLSFTFLLALTCFVSLSEANTPSCDTVEIGFQCEPQLSHFWGQYSPYFAVQSEISSDVPCGCEITFAQILSRHGARDPTKPKTDSYNQTIRDLQANVTSFTGIYSFLANYTYTLGADQLTLFGQQEMIDSGVLFARRYAKLAIGNNPFVRSSSEDRVVESAKNWTQGYQQEINNTSETAVLVISEASGSNNTLNHGLCTNYENGSISEIGDDAKAEFVKTFIPSIRKRLNTDLPGANLSQSQTISLMDLCPFDTVASPGGNSISPFCYLFTEQEWHSYNYYQTLDKFYGHGNGNPLGPTQGVGFVNELLARMTDSPVEDDTSSNHTLDSNPATFPLGRKLYADFSHDNDMTGVFSALGLYNKTAQLSNDTVEEADSKEAQGYSAAWTVPFAARAYFEKMTCRGRSEELVRVVINSRVVPLVGCQADKYGMCALSEFVKSQSFARDDGFWGQCFS